MSDLIKNFKKQGGISLIKDFLRKRTLCFAAFQLLLLGRDKTSLELLRTGITLKTYRKICKKYKPVLLNYDSNRKNNESVCIRSKKIWVCWLQGIENAPDLVKKCYSSLQENLSSREIILITKDNFKQYTDFPEWILRKYEKGLITHTHFSDLLRIELLCKHGGTWIDSTVFCSGKNIPNYMLDSDLFLFQKLKPGADGNIIRVSSWFITSCSNNIVLSAVRELLWQYWKKENSLIDYFLLHHFMMMSLDFYKKKQKEIVQFPNSFPHVLLLMLFDPFNQEKWDAITQACPFHKLAYKRSAEEMSKSGTYYQHIINQEK